MFGYVLPLRGELKVREWEDYRASYCGLCHALRQSCGWAARYVLNYDFTFLALLLEENGAHGTCRCRCPAHPIAGRPCRGGGAALTLAAEESVILAYYKLLDSAHDDGFWKGLGARCAMLALHGSFRRAERAQPQFAQHVKTCLTELDGLEKNREPSLDRTADTFARLLQGAAPVSGDAARDRPMAQLLYHLGRWIYLLDAWDDLAEDAKSGRYNPIAARFQGEPDRTYLETTLRHSLTLCQSAFQLLTPNSRWEVLQNILYLGLPAVQEQVFAGTWRKPQKMSRSMSQ